MAKLSLVLPDSNFFVEVRFCPHSVDVKPGDRLREHVVYCKLDPRDDIVIIPDFFKDEQS